MGRRHAWSDRPGAFACVRCGALCDMGDEATSSRYGVPGMPRELWTTEAPPCRTPAEWEAMADAAQGGRDA